MSVTRLRIVGLVLLVAGLALSACVVPATPAPAEVPEAAPPAEEAPAGEVTITYWHVWGGPRLPLIEQQIADFQALHPNIKVEHTLISQDGMGEKYLTAIAGGDPPDVIMIHGQRHFPSFAANNVLTQLDDLMQRDSVNPDIWFPAEYDTYVWEGKTYALPYATGTGFFLLFWNKDHFRDAGLDPEKPPTTWSELEEYTEKLTTKKDGEFERIGFDPAVGGFPGNYIFREWTFLNNGNIMSKDGKTILFNSPEGLEALKWMVGIYDNYYGGFENVSPIVSGPGTPFRDAFLTGKLSMLVDGVWMPLILQDQGPDIDYGIALVPYNDRNPDATFRNLVEGGWGYAIPRGSKHLEEAWTFLKYVTMEEGNLEFFKGQSRPSPVIEFNNDPFFLESTPYWPVIQEAMEKSEYSPASPVQAKLNDITVQMLEEALLHKKTPEEALQWAAEESQKAVDEWWAQQ